MEATCEADGRLYLVPTMEGSKVLIAFEVADYERFLASGIMDEEVDATIRKALVGSEYMQGSPTAKVRAGLYTITIEGVSVKPQMDIEESAVPDLIERGFRDGDAVKVLVEKLPYRNPREASYEGIKLDMDI